MAHKENFTTAKKVKNLFTLSGSKNRFVFWKKVIIQIEWNEESLMKPSSKLQNKKSKILLCQNNIHEYMEIGRNTKKPPYFRRFFCIDFDNKLIIWVNFCMNGDTSICKHLPIFIICLDDEIIRSGHQFKIFQNKKRWE